MAKDIAQRLRLTNPGNIDDYYGIYPTVEDACLAVPVALRSGKTVGIGTTNIVEYIWHPGNLTDAGLVLKVYSNNINITQAFPLPAGQYYTAASAKLAIPPKERKTGLIISYETGSGVWVTEQYQGSKSLKDAAWEIGAIDNTGNIAGANRIRTVGFLPAKAGDVISLGDTVNVKYAVLVYDTSFVFYSNNAFVTAPTVVVPRPGTGENCFIRIIAAYTSGAVMTANDLITLPILFTSSSPLTNWSSINSWKAIGLNVYDKTESDQRYANIAYSNNINITHSFPLPAGQYYTAASAKAAVPAINSKSGLIITYETSNGVWVTEQYRGSKAFKNESWEVGGIALADGSKATGVTSRIRTVDFLSAKAGDVISISSPTKKFGVIIYNSSFAWVSSHVWFTTSFTIPFDCYIKCVMGNNDDSVLTVSDIPTLTALLTSSGFINWTGAGSWKAFLLGSDDTDEGGTGADTSVITYNSTIKNPLGVGYYTSSLAKSVVPASIRKEGLKVKYEVSSGVWVTEEFKGTDVSKWDYQSLWETEGVNNPLLNLVANGNFNNGFAGYSNTAASTYAIAGNVLKLTGTGTSAAITMYGGFKEYIPINHKIYYKMQIRTTAPDAVQIMVNLNQNPDRSGSRIIIPTPVQNQWYDVERTATVPDEVVNGLRGFIIQTMFASAAAQLGKAVEVKYLTLIDLTSTYGEGNEPTLSELQAVLSGTWFDGAKELESVSQSIENIDISLIEERELLNSTLVEITKIKNENADILQTLLKLESGTAGEKTITIPPIEAEVDNFVLKLALHKGSQEGEVLFDEVFFDGLCKNDFSDIRFEDEDGNFLPFNIHSTGNYDIIRDSKVGVISRYLSNGDILTSPATGGVYRSSNNLATKTLLYPNGMVNFVDSNDNIFVSFNGKYIRLSASDNYANPVEVLDVSDAGADSVIKLDSHIEDSLGNQYCGKYQVAFDLEVFKSTDGGLTWFTIYSNPDNQHVHTMRVDRSVVPNAIYISMDVERSGRGSKTVKSTDYGATWHTLPIPYENADYGVFYVGDGYRLGGGEPEAQGGVSIYKTLDDVNYYPVLNNFQGVRSVVKHNGVLIAGGCADPKNLLQQLFISTDEGETWTTAWAANMVQMSAPLGDGPRYFTNSFTPNGSSESQILIGGNYTGNPIYNPYSWRFFAGGERHHALAYVELGKLPSSGRTIKAKYGYAVKQPNQQVFKDLSENDNLILRFKTNELRGSYIKDSVSGVAYELPKYSSWIEPSEQTARRYNTIVPFVQLPQVAAINLTGGIKVSDQRLLHKNYSVIFFADFFNRSETQFRKLLIGNINGVHIYIIGKDIVVSDGTNFLIFNVLHIPTTTPLTNQFAVTVSNDALPVVKVYINHELVMTKTFTVFNPTITPDKTMFGGWNVSPIYSNINFPISDFRLYNRVLSAAEVRHIYNGYEYFGNL